MTRSPSPWRSPLVRELTWVLLLKLGLLMLLWWLFFSTPPAKPDAQRMTQQLLGTPNASQPASERF